jgi:dihydrofolate reductase
VRKLVTSVYVTLDGVMEDPRWSFPFWSDEAAKFAYDQLFASDALLLGRVTYEGFASAWPGQTDEQGFADRMNSLPKYVVSTTLEEATWNNSTLIKGNVAEEVTRLKQQPGQNLLIYGSADLTRTLMRHDLIDEYRIWVHPVVQGSGKRLFGEGIEKTLRLADAKPLDSGVVILSYQPDRKESQ